MKREGRRIAVQGVVQGVGFRPWVYRIAREKGIAGRVVNDTSGVTIDAFGAGETIDSFVDALKASPPPAARIDGFRCSAIPAENASEFVIVQSRTAEGRRVSIPPDLATCEDCVREIFDPRDRRYRYPFTNCTNCGPRFTIAIDVPYDRGTTTMARFPMCAACRREYQDPLDRRFHAEPIACPACGPTLSALSAAGEPLGWTNPILSAAEALAAGLIVAVKGIGGFHLACDATSSAAVACLRRRKNREEKPFAVMVCDLAQADSIAEIGAPERALLASVERPIVLVPRRAGVPLAPEISPENPLVGLMLPYTPLHHLLLSDAGRPLVMTSGNLSEEPIAFENAEAVRRLGAREGSSGIADVFLAHDREIVTPCDDSVARVICGAPVVLRRSRGYVPRAIRVPIPFREPVLACGANLKNTFCIGVGDSAFLGPHVGDLENLETVRALEEDVDRLERFLGVRPSIVAHDLHPEYQSTAYARRRASELRVGVQHHHAHVVAAMAEHGLSGPVIGVAYDGTGHGTDGTAWGGEILLAREADFDRLATFRPIRLAGGDSAIREVWRIAVALLEDAFEGEAPLERLALLRGIDPEDLRVVRRMALVGIHAPLARGVGRYFDGVGAIALGKPVSSYEGQIAFAWNVAADPSERRTYPFAIDRSITPWTVDLRPLVRAVVGDVLASRGNGEISARFHNTLARVTAELVTGAREQLGPLPVVLTGGCFQNALLAERVVDALSSSRCEVFLHREVPPGDGGIALGQAVVARALVARRQGGI